MGAPAEEQTAMQEARKGADLEGTTRVVAVAIANGLSSEVVVMSRLFSAADRISALVFVQRKDATAAEVERLSSATVSEVEFGWRRPVVGSMPRLARLWRQARRTARVLPGVVRTSRAFRPDVVYSSQQKWDCLVAHILSTILRRPHVVHLHFVPGEILGRYVRRRLTTCDHVIGVSRFIQQHAIAAGVDVERSSYVLNPVPAFNGAATEREQRAGDGDEVSIGFVARVVADKGQMETIQALARLDGDVRQRCRLHLIGTGDHAEEIEALAEELGVADRVEFHGERSDVPDLLSTFDVFVHPSYVDPCPLAVLEAQAASLPVVAFAEGGIVEIVEDQVTGILVENRSVDGLAEALDRLISDRELRLAMGAAAARRTAELFSSAESGRRFEEILAGVAAR